MEEEIKAPDLELNQLISIDDVTGACPSRSDAGDERCRGGRGSACGDGEH